MGVRGGEHFSASTAKFVVNIKSDNVHLTANQLENIT